MTSDSLLEELTSLCFFARNRRLRELGQQARTDQKVAGILDQWEQGSWEERYFCVRSCTGSHDAPRLRRMADGPSRTVSNLATKLLTYHGSDEVLIELLEKSNYRQRLRLLSQLKTLRRFGAIDRFLDAAAAGNLPRIAELVPYGSPRAVERHLSLGAQLGGLSFWRRLARQHSRFACLAMCDLLSHSDEPDGLVLAQAEAVVAFAARVAPDEALALVRLISRFVVLGSLDLNDLQYRRPNELAQIALDADQVLVLNGVAAKLDPSIRLRLLRELPGALQVQEHWLAKLPPKERSVLFQETGRSWRDAEGLTAAPLLQKLPTPEREAEAKRIADLAIMTTRPESQANYAGYLPWESMRPVANRFLSHPEGEMRGWGWQIMLTSLRYHRDHATEVLALVRKRQFEQDPVRLAILQNLTTLPSGIWTDEHLIEIAGIIREALDATDLSHASVAYLTGWVQKLLPKFPKWAAGQLVIIYRERGNLGGYYFESRIDNRQARILQEAFLNVGKEWGKGNRVEWLVRFASALGKRLRACSHLMQILADLLGSESGTHDAEIASLLRQHWPYELFESLVKRLIALHESWVAIPEVFRFLHRHRQDWLAPYLTRTKFTMRGGYIVELMTLLPGSGYERFTAAQQTSLANTITRIRRLPEGKELPWDVAVFLAGVTFLTRLPACDGALLIELAKDERPLVWETALRALGRLDAGQGLQVLMEALNDARGRVAIYALRKAIVERPRADLISLLQRTPMTKITVAKEIIRLVAEFGGAAALDWLLEQLHRDIHRDLRIAVLRGLWEHLEQPEAWPPLQEASQSSDGRLLGGVVRIPADRLSPAARRKLIQLLAALARHSDATVRLAVLKRFIDMPIADDEGEWIRAALAALTAASSDERQLAARAIVKNVMASDASTIAATVTSWQSHRRFLSDFCLTLSVEAGTSAPIRRRLISLAQLLIPALREDPHTAGLRVSLAGSILGVPWLEEELSSLQKSGFPMGAIVREAGAAVSQLSRTKERIHLESLESHMAMAQDPYCRLLAFSALLAQATDVDRWTEDRRKRLQVYRDDSSPIVAIRAQFFFDDDTSQTS